MISKFGGSLNRNDDYDEECCYDGSYVIKLCLCRQKKTLKSSRCCSSKRVRGHKNVIN